MATSPNYGWLEPDNTDLVKNGALAIRTLGNAIDTTMATMVPKSIVDAKGDLIAGTAADTAARLAVGNNGETIVADSSTSTGLRYTAGNPIPNPVLNSAMQIAQRGTSFAVTAGLYTLDRWQGYRGVAGSTITRQNTSDTTNLPNIQYCARIARNSGNTATNTILFTQDFETINSIPFAGKTVTLSFYARAGANYSATSNILYSAIITGTGTDQNNTTGSYTGAAQSLGANVNLTTTWQRFTLTGTIPTTSTEMEVKFGFDPTGTAGANDYYEITGVQIDVGSVALPFRTNGGTIQGELAACQRYYWRWNAATQFATVATGAAVSSTVACVTAYHPVPMRTIVSAIDGSANSTFRLQDQVTGFTQTAVSIEVTQQDVLKTELNVTVASGLTQYRFLRYGANNSTSTYLGFSAEL